MAVGALFLHLVNPQGSSEILMRAFGVVVGSSVKNQMVIAAAEAYFAVHKKPALRDEAIRLLKSHANAASRRNEIAHGTVMTMPTHEPKPDEYGILPGAYFLLPPF